MQNLHWLMNILQHMNVGLVVIDRKHNICMWNSFMENYSGLTNEDVDEKGLFDIYPDLKADWFLKKLDAAFLLDCQMYTNWHERPQVFDFSHYRPITGNLSHMVQQCTFIPLKGSDTTTSHVGILVSDVSDVASSQAHTKRLKSA